jgi:hypothetical protein
MEYDLERDKFKGVVKYHDRSIKRLDRKDYIRFYLSGNNYFAKHMGKKLDSQRIEFLEDKLYSDSIKTNRIYKK